jgi:hypothetical protein
MKKNYSAKCDLLCTVVKGNNCDGGEEIVRVEDVCMAHWNGNKYTIVDLGDFKNSNGDTIAEFLRDVKYDFANKIIKHEMGY